MAETATAGWEALYRPQRLRVPCGIWHIDPAVPQVKRGSAPNTNGGVGFSDCDELPRRTGSYALEAQAALTKGDPDDPDGCAAAARAQPVAQRTGIHTGDAICVAFTFNESVVSIRVISVANGQPTTVEVRGWEPRP